MRLLLDLKLFILLHDNCGVGTYVPIPVAHINFGSATGIVQGDLFAKRS